MNDPQTQLATIPAELEKALSSIVLAEEGRRSLQVAFAPHFQKFADLRESAKGVPVDAPKAARNLRLELKNIRVAADKTRKEQKEDSLRRGKAIDGIYNVLEYELAPIEKAMEQIEKAEEIREQKRKEALQAERMEALRPYVDPSLTASLDLTMAEPLWVNFLAGTKASYEAKIAHAAKVEADRIAAEQAAKEALAKRQADEAAERERMRTENERLAKVAAEERAAREEAERKATQERAALEAKAKAEREAAAKAREEAEKQAATEKAHREAIEAGIKAKERAESKRIADEQAAKDEATRKAAAAPDKQKLTTLAATIRDMPVPAMSSDAGAALRIKVVEQVEKMAKWIEAEVGKL